MFVACRFKGQYLNGVTYHPHGAPHVWTHGNGLAETTTYNSRLQPTKIQAGSLLTLDFTYGTTNNGQIGDRSGTEPE